MPDNDDILEITWDDLRESPAAPAPAAELFPPVEAADAAVAGGRQPWVDVEAVCARARTGFAVRFAQKQPGVYGFSAVLPAKPGALGGKPGLPSGKPGLPAGQPGLPGPGAGLGQVEASFQLAGYTGCPVCGTTELIQCDRCGTIMCGSAVHQDKRGTWVLCPSCGGKGKVAAGVQVTVQGQVGGRKGGKGGGKGW
jgi:predicted RNA-binding Zn-ribbon protein involved in translation (DUF1610 family)